jgi:putative transposase
MSTHSYTRLWTHLIWETLNRETMLDKRAAAKASAFLTEYSIEKGIYIEINYFNADHTHALIDLPTRYSIEEVIKLFKGGSSYWINHSQIIKGKFAWGGGYGAFLVSHSDVARVARYIANQEEHDRKQTYAEEYQLFVRRYGLEGAPRKTIDMVAGQCRCR